MTESDFERYDVTVDLRDNYTSLVTRSKGRELSKIFSEHLGKTKEGQVLIMDFALVTSADLSFLDAFLFPTLRKYRAGEFGNRYIVGMNIDKALLSKLVNKDKLDDKLHSEDLVLAVCDKNGNPYWLGIEDEVAKRLMSILWETGKASPDAIHIELDITESSCSKLIDYLVERRVLRYSQTEMQRIGFYYPILDKRMWQELTKPISREIIDMIKRYDAIEVGCHYLLPSGQHAEEFLHMSKVMRGSRFTAKIARRVVDEFGESIDIALTTATPTNIVIAQKVADLSGGDTQVVFANLDDTGKKLELRPGLDISNKRVLILLDVVFSGFIANMLLKLATEHNSTIIGICFVVDISGGRTNFPPFKVLKVSVLDEPLRTHNTLQCPLCRQGIPLITANVLPRRT